MSVGFVAFFYDVQLYLAVTVFVSILLLQQQITKEQEHYLWLSLLIKDVGRKLGLF